MKFKKITTRVSPIIRIEVLPLSTEEKEIIVDKFFSPSFASCQVKESSIEIYKGKSRKSLACDSLTIEKINITQTINNCGLNVGIYIRVVKTINSEYSTNYEIFYYSIK